MTTTISEAQVEAAANALAVSFCNHWKDWLGRGITFDFVNGGKAWTVEARAALTAAAQAEKEDKQSGEGRVVPETGIEVTPDMIECEEDALLRWEKRRASALTTLARRLYVTMERLDPSAAETTDWEALSERQREFYFWCVDAVLEDVESVRQAAPPVQSGEGQRVPEPFLPTELDDGPDHLGISSTEWNARALDALAQQLTVANDFFYPLIGSAQLIRLNVDRIATLTPAGEMTT